MGNPSRQEGHRLDQNQLCHSANPYLIQHSQNPVHWQEWSRRILEIADGLKRPLFISIGYSTCHWCHVMEEESFSDPETAEILNRFFIPIKIDREERPDLDTYYMNAAHFMRVAGGWPLNVFADSDGVPFWICTYAPPVRRHGMNSFKEIVSILGEKWEKSREEITLQTSKSSEFLKGFFAAEINKVNEEEEDNSELKEDFFMKQMEFIENHQKFFDEADGGFKFQPRVKFPHLMGINHLLELGLYQVNQGKDDLSTLTMAAKGLKGLIRGGIYDHMGGGLFRYSTDYQWRIPHFEKMLYDNALFIEVLCNSCRAAVELMLLPPDRKVKQDWETLLDSFYLNEDGEKNKGASATWREEIGEVLRKTLSYWDSEMSITVKGMPVFYAAQDAGDKNSEGDYYVWHPNEIDEILSIDEIKLFHEYYDLYPFSDTKNTYHLGKKSSIADGSRMIEAIEKKLLQSRTKRQQPRKDFKILLSWNAMISVSYLRVYETFDDKNCLKKGLLNLRFLEEEMAAGEGLYYHGLVHRGDEIIPSPTLAFLGDYAELARAEFYAYRMTGDYGYLKRCLENIENTIKYFYKDGYFSEVNPQHHDGPVATLIEAHDGVEPSSQSLLAELFLQLDVFFPDRGFTEKAAEIFKNFYQEMGNISLPYLTSAFHRYQNDYRMISLYGKGEEFEEMKRSLANRFFSSTLLFLNPEKKPMPSSISETRPTKNQAVICQGQTCSAPLFKINDIIDYLEKN